MYALLALVVVAVLIGLAGLQAGLVAGQPWGRFAWGGRHVVLPAAYRIGSVVAILVYAFFGLVLLQSGGLHELFTDGFVEVVNWLAVGAFAAGAVLNGISRSRPERLVMAPVNLLLAVGALVLALT